jgi:REP element-mobilizing transposase RayT
LLWRREHHSWTLYCYCLMPEHLHLLVQLPRVSQPTSTPALATSPPRASWNRSRPFSTILISPVALAGWRRAALAKEQLRSRAAAG